MTNKNNAMDSREKLEDDVEEICWGKNDDRYFAQKYYLSSYNIEVDEGNVMANHEGHVLMTVIMHLLDRQAAITKSEWAHVHDMYIDNLRGERDAACDRCDKLTAERDHLESQIHQLEGDLKGARTSRDHWRHVAGKHAAEMQRLRKALKAANEYGTIWPRFDGDGAPVRIGDSMMYDEREERVQGIRFYRNSVVFEFAGVDHCRETHGFAIGQDVDRPPLRGADGKPIEEGTLLYGGDGSAWLVESIDRTQKYPIEGSCDGEYKRLKPEWLTHEKPKDSLDDVVLMLRCCPGLDGRDCDVLADRIERIAKEAGR